MTEGSKDMQEALRAQLDHAVSSFRIDRRGWTEQAWVDDARRLFADVDGSVLDLVNGHVVHMLAALDRVTGERDRARDTAVRLEQELARAEGVLAGLRDSASRIGPGRDDLDLLMWAGDALTIISQEDVLAQARREGWRPAGGLVSE